MDFLDRVIDVTEHHDHAVPEQPVEQWNSRTYNCDLTRYKEGLETQFRRSSTFQVKGSTPTMLVIADAKNVLEMRVLFEPNGSGTCVTITCHGAQGDITEQARDYILDLLNNFDNAAKVIPKQLVRGPVRLAPTRTDRMFILIVLVTVGAVCLLVLISTGLGRSDKTQAAVAQPSATATPTPGVQRRIPHKAKRGR
jgi:hypothetical protein